MLCWPIVRGLGVKDNPLKAILVNRSGCGVDVKTGKGKVFLIFILFERLLSLAALE